MTAPSGSSEDSPRFPAHRLEVYGLACEFQERIERVLPRLCRIKPHLAHQLDRAVSSLVLNIGEGATEFSVGDKRRFYRIALRSGGESAAALEFFARRVDLRAELALLNTIFRKLTPLCTLSRRRPPPEEPRP